MSEGKQSPHGQYSSVRDRITYTILVTNTGNVILNGVTISDPMLTTECNVNLGGQTYEFSEDYTVQPVDMQKGSIPAIMRSSLGKSGSAWRAISHILTAVREAYRLEKMVPA